MGKLIFSKRRITVLLISIIFIFVLSKLVFFHLTPAEWGDSYRFLRAGEYFSKLSYPLDEKRLPLFSLLLAPAFLLNIDPISWGRALVLVLSVFCLFLVFKLSQRICPKNSAGPVLAVAITAFSPTFFYWTGKIYSEILFAFLVLLSFYFHYKKLSRFKYFVLGIICGLTFMTRFEGFLLFLSFFTFFLINRSLRSIRTCIDFAGGFILPVLPYFILKYLNLDIVPSNYFSELLSFNYDMRVIWIYLASFVFIFGFVPFFGVGKILNTVKGLLTSNIQYIPIVLFVVLELVLILLWPSAVPRLFVPIIPLLAIAASYIICEGKSERNIKNLIFSLGLLLFFILSRFYLKLPFLVLGKIVGGVILLNFAAIIFAWLDKKIFYILLNILCSVISTLVVTNFFKTNYKTIYEATTYSKSLNGKIAFSDETGVVSWYLRNGKGVFYDLDLSNESEYKWLRENSILYIIDTNEHNEGSKLEVFKDESYKDRFEEVAKFKSNVGITETRSVIYKVL